VAAASADVRLRHHDAGGNAGIAACAGAGTKSGRYVTERGFLIFIRKFRQSPAFFPAEYDVLKLGDLKFDFVDTILDLGVFRPTENVTFPPKYRPPNLVRKEIYWQCWKIVVLLAAAEPSLFGKEEKKFEKKFPQVSHR
jgi:hypothetical protein